MSLRYSGHCGTKKLTQGTDAEMSKKPACNTKSWEDDILMSLRTKGLWRKSWMHHIYGVQLSPVSDLVVGCYELSGYSIRELVI